MIAPVEIARDYRLDLYRGLALWLIFLAHVPGTIINKLTPWNYGFSDAAEIFVFVSGYANAFVYGRVMEQRGFLIAAAHVWHRTFGIYVAQMFLFMLFIGEIAWLSHGSHAFDDAMNIRVFYEHPDEAILAVLQLRFMPVNMDVLPVYIVLLVVSPILLWLLWRIPVLVLTIAGLVYLTANLSGLNLPSYPHAHWYFNPFAWQLVFVLGAWCGMGAVHWVWSLVGSRTVFAVATVYLFLGFAVFMAVKSLDLTAWVPQWVQAGFGKTNLGILRLSHFLALAIVIHRLIPADWPLLKWRLSRPLIQCGQHSLEVFCLSVILAFAGQVAITSQSNSLLVRLPIVVAGIAAMISLASLASWYGSTKVSFRASDPGPQPVAVTTAPADNPAGPRRRPVESVSA